MTVTPNGSTVLVTGADSGPGAEFVYQAIDLVAKVYATAARRVTGHISQARLRALVNAHADQVEVFSAHDPAELDRYLLATATLP
jgi:NAD(P)-dependent dehydrogenase (short-subunit alcohol dehydrogenase family)